MGHRLFFWIATFITTILSASSTALATAALPLYSQYGTAAEYFGSALVGIGDANQDGFGDFIVGSYHDGTVGASAGKAQLYSGKDGAILYTKFGAAAGDLFGVAVAGVGDLNHDGAADFAVGAMKSGSGGYVVIYSGKDGSVLKTLVGPHGGNFGNAVQSMGDLNHDGIADFAIAAKGEAVVVGSQALTGVVRIYSGSAVAGYPILCTIHPANAANGIEGFGGAIAYAGDTDGDGIVEILIGAPQYSPPNCLSGTCSDSGEAEIFTADVAHGCPFLASFVGTQYAGNNFGDAVAGAGDLNGDGNMEIAIGEPQADYDPVTLIKSPNRNNGAVDIYTFDTGLQQFKLLRRLAGQTNSMQIGSALTSVGDVDGDGVFDLLVGGRGRVNGVDDVGRARLYSGTDLNKSAISNINLTFLYENFGAGPSEQYGYRAGNAGDIDGDGINDWLVAAIHNGNGAIEALSSCSFTAFGCFPNANGFGSTPPPGGPVPPLAIDHPNNPPTDDDGITTQDHAAQDVPAEASGGCGVLLGTVKDQEQTSVFLLLLAFLLLLMQQWRRQIRW